MAGNIISVKVVLADSMMPILTNIGKKLTGESPIEIHNLINSNAASVAKNPGGGRNGHLSLNTTAEEYKSQKDYTFVPLQNPDYYSPTIGIAQQQALGTERLQHNQALLRRCTAMDGVIKKQIIMAMQPVFLYPLMDQLMGFGQMTALKMLQHLFNSYGATDEINL